MNVYLMPTMACQLMCSHCYARRFPYRHNVTKEPEEWARVLSPLLGNGWLRLVGREPSGYPGLRDLLAAVECDHISIDTNLMIQPWSWLHDVFAHKVKLINAGLQYHPDDPQSGVFWEHIKWLRSYHQHMKLNVVNVLYQYDLPSQVEVVNRRAANAGEGINVIHHPFSPRYMSKSVRFRDSVAECACGTSSLFVLPDGTAHRCAARAISDATPVGNIFDQLVLGESACSEVCCADSDMARWSRGEGDDYVDIFGS